MTVTDFVLMAALVISTTFGLLRAVGAKHPIERGICLLGGLVLWLCTGMMVRNVWIDANFKKAVVAEMDHL